MPPKASNKWVNASQGTERAANAASGSISRSQRSILSLRSRTAAISAAEMRAPPRFARLRSSSPNAAAGETSSATVPGYASRNLSTGSRPFSTSIPLRREIRAGSAGTGMNTPQAGIFALGTASHAYLEFNLEDEKDGPELVRTASSLREPRTTMGGVNLVVGFRPELWREVSHSELPDQVAGFDEDLAGADGFAMPATQHDAVLWVSGSAYDVVFDVARAAIAALAALATVAEETSSWPYRHDRDLTGFIDGSENPDLIDAPELVLVPEGRPGAGGTILLLQKWLHDAPAWEGLTDAEQEQVIGRTKLDSIELDPKPADSHVASTDQDRFGKIFRRNMPFGTVSEHGTMFVGFSAEQRPLVVMLESMAGVGGGPPDALTRFTKPLSGAYYFVPSTEALRAVGA